MNPLMQALSGGGMGQTMGPPPMAMGSAMQPMMPMGMDADMDPGVDMGYGGGPPDLSSLPPEMVDAVLQILAAQGMGGGQGMMSPPPMRSVAPSAGGGMC